MKILCRIFGCNPDIEGAVEQAEKLYDLNTGKATVNCLCSRCGEEDGTHIRVRNVENIKAQMNQKVT